MLRSSTLFRSIAASPRASAAWPLTSVDTDSGLVAAVPSRGGAGALTGSTRAAGSGSAGAEMSIKCSTRSLSWAVTSCIRWLNSSVSWLVSRVATACSAR